MFDVSPYMPVITALTTLIGTIVALISAVKAHAAKEAAVSVREQTLMLRVEVNHRLDEMLKMTRAEGFAAGQVDQGVVSVAATTAAAAAAAATKVIADKGEKYR